MLSEKLKWMIVIFVVYFAIGAMLYSFPTDIVIPDIHFTPDIYFTGGPIQTILLVLWLIGLIIFGLTTPNFCWKHPKWYVKVYTRFVAFWEGSFILCMMVFVFLDIPFFLLYLLVGMTVPLIPLWYLLNKHKFPEEWKSKEHT